MLNISEREAARILFREKQRRGTDSGLINFAREVLGASYPKAKEMTGIVTSIVIEDALDEFSFPDETDDEPTLDIQGDTLKMSLDGDGPATIEEVAQAYGVDLSVWTPDYQTFAVRDTASGKKFRTLAKFTYDAEAEFRQADREAIREWMSHRPAPAFLERPGLRPSKGRLLEIVVSDLHVDRFVEGRYGVEESLARLKTSVRDILGRGIEHGIEQVKLVFLGDTFNDDNGRRTTTKGTPQQSEGAWRTVFTRVRETIADLATIAGTLVGETEIIIIPGNHDRERSFYLAETLAGYFESSPYVHVRTNPAEIEYIDWGVNLISLDHGDSIKPRQLANKILRHSSGHSVIEAQRGHIHTRTLHTEIEGVLVRNFGSPAPESDWEREQGYEGNLSQITGIIWHRELGKEAEFYYNFLES